MAFQATSPRRGRRRGGGFVTRPGQDRYPTQPGSRSITESRPLGELLAILEITDLGHAGHDSPIDATVRDCNYVTSYNWLDTESPTVVIPGQHHHSLVVKDLDLILKRKTA